MSGIRERLPERLRWLPRDVGYTALPRIASAIRKWWVLLRHPHARIVFGPGTYLGPGFSLHVPAEGTFVCGSDCEFRRGFRCEVSPGAKVEIGPGCRFTYACVIQCGTTIDIGARAVFAESSSVFDGSHRFKDPSRPVLEQGYDFRPIRIGDDATVMAKCTVIADVGEHAFIGANSVVTRPIPAYTLAVGAPARPVEYYGPPGSEPDELTAARSSK